MKTKFKLEINGKGENLTQICEAIANHNDGTSNIDLDSICGCLMFQKARFPETYKRLKILSEGDNNQTIHISDDDGESYYLSITECEMEELREEVELPDYMKVPKMEF